MFRRAAVPVLTYHGTRVGGPDPATNDHVALAADLERLHALGVRVVSLAELARALVEGRLGSLRGCVALSLDDGSDFDARDLPHPAWGPQRAMLAILRDFRARHGVAAQPGLHATSFVIVSPEARVRMDRHELIGCGWWNDDWWREAEASGMMAVESHSWDHNQLTLERSATSAPRGGFAITDRADADAEIAQATRYLRERRGRGGEALFAYPYGPASDYLADEYFPDTSAGHGVYAAFTTGAKPVTAGTGRWRIPRFVCGHDWRSPDDLERLLADCGIRAGRRGLLAWLRDAPAPRAPEPPAPREPEPPGNWRECLGVWEVNDARAVAGELFRRSFGHDVPDFPRHFVMVYSPPPGSSEAGPLVVAYVHHTPFEGVHLTGGMCVDAAVYRKLPKAVFDQVREEGGLATIILRDTFARLGDSAAAFGFVGEPRARAADLRAGFVDTDRPQLMVFWRRELPGDERRRLVDLVDAVGPF